MRTVLILLLLSCRMFGAWSYCVPITFNNHPASTLTDFPAHFCANGATGAYCDSVAHSNLVLSILKTVANGGAVTSSSGYDIGWFSDTLCTSSVPFQLVPGVYSGTTGLIEMHVLVSSLASGSDTFRYLGVGNSAITTDQSSTSTWNSAYKAVWHLANGSSLNLTDSTSNGRTITNASGGDALTAGAALIDGGTGSTQGYGTFDDTGLPSGAGSRTLECWVNGTAFATDTSTGGYITYGNYPTADQFVRLIFIVGKWMANDANVNVGFADTPTTGIWYHFAFTYDGTNVRVYLNGSLVAGPTAATWNTTLTGAGTAFFCSQNQGVSTFRCNATQDEARISNVARSADWLASTVNSLKEPWNFYTIGTPLFLGGNAAIRKQPIIF